LDGRTPYDMVYGVKPDLADLRAFGAPCAIVEPGVKLKKVDDRAKTGGDRVWDPRESVVVETRM